MIKQRSFNVLENTEQKIWQLDDVKNYLRISSDFDDKLLMHLLETSVKAAENFIGTNLTIKKIIMRDLDKYAHYFSLKYKPILEIRKIAIKNNNIERELNADEYSVDFETAKLHLLKTIKKDELSATFIVGVDQNNLSPDIKQGILIHTCQMFERQESSALSAEIRNLYAPYRNIRI